MKCNINILLLLLEANTPEDLMVLRSELSSLKATTVGEMKIASPPDNSRVSPDSEEFAVYHLDFCIRPAACSNRHVLMRVHETPS